MSDYDKNEDIVFYGAFALFAVLGAIGLIVLLSGHGVIPPPAHPVAPGGVTATQGQASSTP